MSWKIFKRIWWIGFFICLSLCLWAHIYADWMFPTKGLTTGLLAGWVIVIGGGGLGWYMPEDRTDD